MEKIQNIFKLNKKAFTLVEFAVTLGISAFLVVIIYTLLLTAHQSFREMYDASRNSNNIRYFENSLRESFSYIKGTPIVKSDKTLLKVYRNVGNKTLTDTYTVSAADCMVGPSSTKANTLADLRSNTGLNTNSTKANPTYYTLDRKTEGGEATITTRVLSNIRNIYINRESAGGASGYERLRIGVIYDEIFSNGKTNIVRPKRRVFCFTSKG